MGHSLALPPPAAQLGQPLQRRALLLGRLRVDDVVAVELDEPPLVLAHHAGHGRPQFSQRSEHLGDVELPRQLVDAVAVEPEAVVEADAVAAAGAAHLEGAAEVVEEVGEGVGVPLAVYQRVAEVVEDRLVHKLLYHIFEPIFKQSYTLEFRS